MRYRLIGSILVCLFSASIFAARFSAGSATLRVNESATKFSLKKEGAVVSLASESARLGEYFIEAWLGEEGPRNAPGGQPFKISRYDLPNFVISVKPDRGYYLPGQNAEVKPESWFELLGAARKRAEVKAGKQRVTAFGSDAGDAFEKPVRVHPDVEEVAQTASGVFGESGSLDVVVAMDAIKDSVRADLKIYPNLMAHALEGIEGILQRPYGCAEQTISSTYPNVMILRYLEPQSEKLSAPMRKIAEKARRYAQAGYERLLGYRAENGGFSYWGREEADLALTAYALRFLNDTSDFIGVD